jgi:serine/threonine protein phosphatase 1
VVPDIFGGAKEGPMELFLAWNVLGSRKTKLKPRIPSDQRVYAIGDVHGRADLLANLFARIDSDLRARPIRHSIHVLLGDYIDRGPDSRQTVELLIERRKGYDLIPLKGNHEQCALNVLRDPSSVLQWKAIGGLNTILSYGVAPKWSDDLESMSAIAQAFTNNLPEPHRRFLQSLPLSFTCGDFFFVHAGARPGIRLHEQSENDLLWIREDFLLHEEDFGKIVVHGHTPNLEPEVKPNRINIDTGAYATGRLTCLVLEDDDMRFL